MYTMPSRVAGSGYEWVTPFHLAQAVKWSLPEADSRAKPRL